MKCLFISIFLLSSVAGYGQTQPILTQPIEAGQQQRQHSITHLVAANQIAPQANGTYSAAQSVTLQPGFLAQTGAVFLAIIRVEQSLSDEEATRLSLRAFPNPFGATTRIEYVLPHGSQVRGVLTDMQGQIISQQAGATWQEAGRHELSVSGVDLPVGTYIYQLQAGSQSIAIRLIKQP